MSLLAQRFAHLAWLQHSATRLAQLKCDYDHALYLTVQPVLDNEEEAVIFSTEQVELGAQSIVAI